MEYENRKPKQNQIKAAKKAQKLWEKAEPVKPKHQYLTTKKIKAYGIKQYRDALILPIYDKHSQIISLQLIFQNGKKRFLKYGKTQGDFFPIGDTENKETIYIGEGYATMATIHKVTGTACIITFTSGNLKIVAHIIKDKYPNNEIIITSDNDIKTQEKTVKNTGIEAGKEPARAIDSKICIYRVDSDFNDLFLQQGSETVKRALNEIKKVEFDDWEEPILLKENNPPEFESNLLPGIIGDIAKAAAEFTETLIELSAGLILSVLAATCHGKFVVEVKAGYKEPLNIWTLAALDSENRKSSVLKEITKPLNEWEQSKYKELETVVKNAEIKLKNQEARLKSLRGKLGKTKKKDYKNIEYEILEIEKKRVEIPLYPKICVQDITPEYLGTVLYEHSETMSILSAEGGIFDIIG